MIKWKQKENNTRFMGLGKNMLEDVIDFFKFLTPIMIIVILVMIICWYVGGIHLDYLKSEGQLKAQEICGQDAQIIYQGYQRSLFGGFGGRVWYQCKKDNLWYQFAITRRINTKELQIYVFEQKTLFPSQFDFNQ